MFNKVKFTMFCQGANCKGKLTMFDEEQKFTLDIKLQQVN